MYTNDEEKELNKILEILTENLDISESQYNMAVSSYEAVGRYLSEPPSPLAKYSPTIKPQGSFMLGTITKPIIEQDDIDIDLVCELSGKDLRWTQYDVKQIVGNRLKNHDIYFGMLKPEGRRCWTLKYSESANYHMDILPSIIDENYKKNLLKLSSSYISDASLDPLAIRITDKKTANYMTEILTFNWLKTNPFGFAIWFFNKATLSLQEQVRLFSNSVKNVPEYQKTKLPLQRAIQILKRHRDMMFNGDDEKPTSIIITTLATKAYKKETNLISALKNIIDNMDSYIEERNGQKIIVNPVNLEENFADKWVNYPKRKENFYKWLYKLKKDFSDIKLQKGLHNISNSMKPMFGEQVVTKTFSTLSSQAYEERISGNQKMSIKSGILGSTGSIINKPHNFHGN